MTSTTKPRLYPDLAKWRMRYGPKAECIGIDQTCRRPVDSDDVEACVGCPYLVNREPGKMGVVSHPEGGI